MRFFLCENDEIFTEDALRKDFDLHKADLPEFDTFEEFLEMCQSYNNGALTEIPEREMHRVWVTETHTDNYGCRHADSAYNTYLFRIKEKVWNYDTICKDGVNSVIIDNDDGKVIQVSGYTREKGFWFELY